MASLFLVRPGATSRVLAPFVAMPFVTSSEEGEPNEQTNNITYRLQGHFITPHVFGPSVVPHRFHVRTRRQGEDFFFPHQPTLYQTCIPDHPEYQTILLGCPGWTHYFTILVGLREHVNVVAEWRQPGTAISRHSPRAIGNLCCRALCPPLLVSCPSSWGQGTSEGLCAIGRFGMSAE